MLEPGYYRRQALACLSLARSSRDSELSTRLIDMATRLLEKETPFPVDHAPADKPGTFRKVALRLPEDAPLLHQLFTQLS